MDIKSDVFSLFQMPCQSSSVKLMKKLSASDWVFADRFAYKSESLFIYEGSKWKSLVLV